MFIVSALFDAFGNIWIEMALLFNDHTSTDLSHVFIKIVTEIVFFLFYLIFLKIRYKKDKMSYIPYYSYINLLFSISFLLLPLVIIRFFSKSLHPLVIAFVFIFVFFSMISSIYFFLKHTHKLIENSKYKLEISYKEQLLSLQKKKAYFSKKERKRNTKIKQNVISSHPHNVNVCASYFFCVSK